MLAGKDDVHGGEAEELEGTQSSDKDKNNVWDGREIRENRKGLGDDPDH